MTPALRVTLVHELTHVVQDQHFDLRQLDGFQSSDLEAGFRALAEGDATRIENHYIDSLDTADRKAYDDTTATQSDAAGVDLSGVPYALVAYFGAPYVLGTDLVDLLEQTGGDKAINQAFDVPPDSEAVLLDPFRFLDGDAATHVPAPALEPGEVKVDDGDMGAIAFSCFSKDSSIPTTRPRRRRRGGRRCLRRLHAVMDAPVCVCCDRWTCLRARGGVSSTSCSPSGRQRSLRQTPPSAADDTTVTFESCDPGADATVGEALALRHRALALPVIRTEIALGVIHDGADPGVRAMPGRPHRRTSTPSTT